MSQQGLRQASFRAIHGAAGGTYEEDARKAFAAEATIPAGATFNEAFLIWLQARLGSSVNNLQQLMNEFAIAEGAYNWSSLGTFAAAYTANPVHFDGTADFLTRGAALTGAVDSKAWTGSFWIRRTGGEGVLQRVLFGATQDSGSITINASNQIAFQGKDVGGAADLLIRTTSAITGTAWHHIMFSVDMTSSTKRHVYLDGASSLTVTTYNNDTLDWTTTDYVVGATAAGAGKLNADLADLQMWFGVYTDLSVVANRRNFLKDYGRPVNPSSATTALGTPTILLSGATAGWETNDGSGGGFTENGALTDGTGPVEL